MSTLQTIIRKNCINDVQKDSQLLWIELRSCELSSSEQNTLTAINLEQNPVGLDVFAKLYKEGIVKKVGRSATGNWCLEVTKSDLSVEELNELEAYVSQNRPIGNTVKNRSCVAKQSSDIFSK